MLRSPSKLKFPLSPDPKTLWVGLGCRRGTSVYLFEYALRTVFQTYAIDWGAIAGVATLDLKQTEPGLLALSLTQHWSMLYFSTADLKSCIVPHPSAKVNAAISLFSVCEAAALKAAALANPGLLSLPKLVVPKQIIRLPTELGAVTVAIATHQESAQAYSSCE
jgi:cobalamin biosynthesis protein CbiG